MKPPVGMRPDRDYLLKYGIVGWWLLNEGGGPVIRSVARSAADWGGLGVTPTWVHGATGPALSFNGSPQYMVLPTNVLIAFPASVSFRMLTNVATDGVMFGLYSAGFWMGGGFYNSEFLTTNNAIGAAGSSFNNNSWNRVVIAQQSSSVGKVYVNGIDVTATVSFPWSSGANSSLGARYSTGDVINYPYTGLLDDFRAYNRALSADEVRRIDMFPYEAFRIPPIFLFTTPSATQGKTVNGLAKASIKTVNGLATASVKTVTGVASFF